MKSAFLILLFFSLSLLADEKVKPSELTAITNAQVTTSDLLTVFDTSAGITKKMPFFEVDKRFSTKASPNFSGVVTTPALKVTGETGNRACYLDSSKSVKASATTSTELGYLAGVSSSVQDQIDGKATAVDPTFSGNITFSTGTANTVPYLNVSKQVTSSAVTPTELGYLAGVSSSVQTQLGTKAPAASPTFSGVATMGSASGADIYWSTAAAGSIGVATGQTATSPDRRPLKMYLKDALIIGSPNSLPPYGTNNSLVTGGLLVGNQINVQMGLGANTFWNSTALGYVGFGKDGSGANSPAFYNLDASSTDFNVYFGNLHRSTTRDDYLKFGTGTVTFLKTSGAHLLWNTDGAGDIGASGATRPNNVYVKNNGVIGNGLTVANGVTLGANAASDVTWSTDGGGGPAVAQIATVQTIANTSNQLRNTCFDIETPGGAYYVWYKSAGTGSDPGCNGGTAILVSLALNDTAATVASLTQTALLAVGGTPFSVSLVSTTLTITNTTAGAVANAPSDDGGNPTGFTVTLVQSGADTSGGHIGVAHDNVVSGRPLSISTSKYANIGDAKQNETGTEDYYTGYMNVGARIDGTTDQVAYLGAAGGSGQIGFGALNAGFHYFELMPAGAYSGQWYAPNTLGDVAYWTNGSGVSMVLRESGQVDFQNQIHLHSAGAGLFTDDDSGFDLHLYAGDSTGAASGAGVGVKGGDSVTGQAGDVALDGGVASSGTGRGGDVIVTGGTSAGGRAGGLRIANSHTPASSSEACTAGQIHWDASFLYVCTATDTWKRAALLTF
jgi:hypothetical protein